MPILDRAEYSVGVNGLRCHEREFSPSSRRDRASIHDNRTAIGLAIRCRVFLRRPVANGYGCINRHPIFQIRFAPAFMRAKRGR